MSSAEQHQQDQALELSVLCDQLIEIDEQQQPNPPRPTPSVQTFGWLSTIQGEEKRRITISRTVAPLKGAMHGVMVELEGSVGTRYSTYLSPVARLSSAQSSPDQNMTTTEMRRQLHETVRLSDTPDEHVGLSWFFTEMINNEVGVDPNTIRFNSITGASHYDGEGARSAIASVIDSIFAADIPVAVSKKAFIDIGGATLVLTNSTPVAPLHLPTSQTLTDPHIISIHGREPGIATRLTVNHGANPHPGAYSIDGIHSNETDTLIANAQIIINKLSEIIEAQ